MANTKKTNRRRREVAAPTAFEQARDELFQHIMQCGVIGALPEHQNEWFTETMSFVAGRYPELSDLELTQLRTLGERFVQPPKSKQPSDGESAETPEPESEPESEVETEAELASNAA